MPANKVSRVLTGRYPPPGTSSIADAIRDRRGPQGITPLDAALLHVPPVASGWNAIGRAIRSEGKLPGDIRELLVCFMQRQGEDIHYHHRSCAWRLSIAQHSSGSNMRN
ncbi:hypothetical protein C0992_006249 [Termitomyces sp. T32_za158]|nr:hypothetical protein C0992_006249 [Termitomyces sp. T32_za158]